MVGPRGIPTTLLLVLASIAMAWEPDSLTQLEVRKAAAFTDGTLVSCDNNPYTSRFVEALEGDRFERWIVCVDTSQTPWDEFDLMQWAVYGLDKWVVMEEWEDRVGDGWAYKMGLLDYSRGEALTIYVMKPIDRIMYSISNLRR